MKRKSECVDVIQTDFLRLSEYFLERGITLESLKSVISSAENVEKKKRGISNIVYSKKILLFAVIIPIVLIPIVDIAKIDSLLKYAYGTRCIVPNNYLVWEFTRPISNCEFCRDVDSALILPNLTQKEFEPYAYSSRPIIVKGAASHWPASKVFSLKFFRHLYETIDGAYTSMEEECQFLHFKSNFSKLQDVFEMTERRALNLEGEESWYVGWKNCHPQVLEIMKRFYDSPHFFPDDAEISQTNYVFLGYDQGAVMHLDYIPRLMWQGQLLGSKTWTVAPTPECENICKPFNFSVATGDIVLIDTRIWYHDLIMDEAKDQKEENCIACFRYMHLCDK